MALTISAILILITGQVLGLATSEIICDEAVDSICLNGEYSESVSEEHSIFYREEFLMQYCSEILLDYQCRLEYLTACDPGGVDQFLGIAGGVNDVFTELCNESSDSRKNHRLHNSCLGNLTSEFDNCISRAMSTLYEPNETEAHEDDAKTKIVAERLCSVYKPFRHCVSEITHEVCGEEAAIYLKYIVDLATGRFVSTNCNYQSSLPMPSSS